MICGTNAKYTVASVVEITIVTAPTTTTYTVNSSGTVTFDFTGAVVMATYSNGSTKQIDPVWSPLTDSITDTTTSKTTTVTATYQDFTDTTTMTVNNPVSSLSVSPASTTYEVSATSSGTVTATYTNGKTQTVSATTSPSTIAYNTTSVTFSYGGKTVSQTVSNVTKTMFYNSGVTWTGYQSGGSSGAHSLSTTQMVMKNGSNGGYGYYASSVNLSQWNYISVTYSITTSTTTDTFFKVKYANANAWGTDYDIISITNSSAVSNKTTKKALTSGLGSRNIRCVAHSYNSTAGVFTVTVTKVVLSRA